MNRKPPELHVIDGTRPNHNKPDKPKPAALPENIRKRIPKAEWLDDPDKWDRNAFIEETSEFLHDVYGIGCDQDKHTLSILAEHIETYVRCSQGIKKTGVVTSFNNGATFGPSPYLSVRNKTTTLIIQLMNELGLTPRSRLASNKHDDDNVVQAFLRGPKG